MQNPQVKDKGWLIDSNTLNGFMKPQSKGIHHKCEILYGLVEKQQVTRELFTAYCCCHHAGFLAHMWTKILFLIPCNTPEGRMEHKGQSLAIKHNVCGLNYKDNISQETAVSLLPSVFPDRSGRKRTDDSTSLAPILRKTNPSNSDPVTCRRTAALPEDTAPVFGSSGS
ncbi:hypothetical protein MJT46_013568 [Ovis ammon polii x Ovis aries]|nr:hypothetical protein MJT46_013568 [Ovis ammon polii x Ovis aries]